MAKRLDVEVAVNVLGKPVLRERVDKYVWYYLHQYTYRQDEPYITENIKFDSEVELDGKIKIVNPIEYLIFNNHDFGMWFNTQVRIDDEDPAMVELVGKITGEDVTDLDLGDVMWEYIRINEEIPTEWQEFLWLKFKELSHEKIKQIFEHHDVQGAVYLFDKDFKQLLPVKDTALTENFLGEWFPQ
jgi:hypothetical protein